MSSMVALECRTIMPRDTSAARLGVQKLLVCAASAQADAGTRTPDPLLTMEVLYQLSYVGANGES